MHLFIYGSLKKGEYNHKRFNFHKIAQRLGAATTRDLTLYTPDAVPYPIALRNPVPGKVVRGELYWVDDRTADGQALLYSLLQMELDAGYTVAEVTAWHKQARYIAMTFVFHPAIRLQTDQIPTTTNWKGENHA